MDTSNNKIDLLYLTNPAILQKYNKTLIKTKINENEIEFYKKRIFQITKDLLRKKNVNTLIDESFRNFVNVCINYFKFQDKMDFYQNEYKDLVEVKKDVSNNFNLANTDNLVTKRIILEQKTVKELFNMKSNKKKSRMKIPKQKKIDINGTKFRTKGVKEKSK